MQPETLPPETMCVHARWAEHCFTCEMAGVPRGREARVRTPAVVNQELTRTVRGAEVTVRLTRHRTHVTYFTASAKTKDRTIAEYTSLVAGSAAMVAACYEAGVVDLQTPLWALPAGLSQRMGRVWLKLEGDRCHVSAHVVGAKRDCPHALGTPDRHGTTRLALTDPHQQRAESGSILAPAEKSSNEALAALEAL